VVLVNLAPGLLDGVRTGPWYESSAQALVLKEQLPSEPISGPNPEARQEDSLSTHMLLIPSPRVVARAVQTEKLAPFAVFRRIGRQTARKRPWLAFSWPRAGPASA